MYGIKFVLYRVPFFLEPEYNDKPPDFWEPHDTRMIRKFGSKEAFERVKSSHGLGNIAQIYSIFPVVCCSLLIHVYILLIITVILGPGLAGGLSPVPRAAEVGLTESVGFTQTNLTKRRQSSTLDAHRLIYYVTEVYTCVFFTVMHRFWFICS